MGIKWPKISRLVIGVRGPRVSAPSAREVTRAMKIRVLRVARPTRARSSRMAQVRSQRAGLRDAIVRT